MLTTVLTVTSAQEITVLVWCADPPCFFPEGWAFAQTFLLPEMGENLPSEPCVAWTKQIGSGRIKLTCTLTCLNKTITLTAFVDTAADVMIISQDYWLPEWTLVPSLDALVGIRGHSNTVWSLHPVSFKGPEDRVATAKPFVINRSQILVWGRDILSQWGLKLETNF